MCICADKYHNLSHKSLSGVFIVRTMHGIAEIFYQYGMINSYWKPIRNENQLALYQYEMIIDEFRITWIVQK
jgi:hypothetical protein